MLKRTIATVFVTALLCLGLLPVTALAAAPENQVIYVGGEEVTSGGYWMTDSEGNVIEYSGTGTPTDNYIHYDAENNVLTLHNATIKNELEFNESIEGGTFISGSAIGVFNKSGNAELTISLVGTNTIANVGKGIFVLASSASTGSSNLTIQGDGSLNASASQTGIWVQSNSNNAALCVENAEVTASVDGAFNDGVLVQAKDGSDVSLTVNGGSLTASVNANIWFQFGSGLSGSGTPTVTVSNNAIVRANGGIANNSSSPIQYKTGNDGTGGIVWNGSNGTVYGSVTLQDDLTIGEGESLTIPNGSSLTIPDDKTLTVNGGALTGDVTGTVIYKVTGVSLNKDSLSLEPGGSEALTATVTPDNATNKKVTWSSSAPDVAVVDASGNLTAVAEGTATITAATEDGGKTATCTVTVEHAHDPAAGWSSDASGHWHACAGCGEKLDFAAHSGKVVGKRDATCTEAGYTGDTVCSICGYVVAKGVATPATDHSYQDGICAVCGAEEPAKDEDAIPATGDLAPMACALAGIFGMTLVAAGLRKRTSW